MKIYQGLCLVMLIPGLTQCQTVAAGARAVVNNDTLPVYVSMSESADVRATLKRGDFVTIGLVLFGSETTWCAISKPGETKRLGYVSCEFLESDRATTATSSSEPVAPPAPARPKANPVTIREVPAAAITVREAPMAALSASGSVHEAAIPEPVPATAANPITAPPPVAALPDPMPVSNPGDFIEAVIDAAGLRSALMNYTQTTHLLSFLDKSRLAEIEVAGLQRLLLKRFQPGAFYQAIGSQVRKSYSSERLPAITKWLDSPVTSKLAALERRALSAGARQELVDFAASLNDSPPTQSRLLLIHRLNDSLRTGEMEVETTIALVHTVAQAIGPALPKEKRYSGVELDRALGAVKARYRSVMKNARIVHYLFAYQSATDDELEQYVSFLESDSGKWLISLVDKGFYEATETISQGLQVDIPRNVKPKRHLPVENTAKGLLP